MKFLHQSYSRIGAKRAGTCPHRVKTHHMAQFIGLMASHEHAFYSSFIQCADINIQSAADGSNILNILRLIGHDRASPAGKQHICDIIDRHIIGNIMYQRHRLSYIVQTLSQHFLFPPFAHEKRICRLRHIRLITYVISLRWHYPNQVYGSRQYQPTLSLLLSASSPLFCFIQR